MKISPLTRRLALVAGLAPWTVTWFPSQGVASHSMEICGDHAAALGEDGFLRQWGRTELGRIGTPLPSVGLYDFRDFSCGYHSSLAMDSDGNLFGWGVNYGGSLGPEEPTSGYLVAAALPLLDRVAKVEVSDFAMALREDGTVWMWGGPYFPWWLPDPRNASVEERGTPVLVEGIDSVVEIAAPSYIDVTFGGATVLALKGDGSVWTWGMDTPTPTVVEGLQDIVAIDTFANHHIALRSDGSVWTWGFAYRGVLGTGEESGYRATPRQVTGLAEIVDIAAGNYHMLALSADGTVWGWGKNTSGELNVSDLEYVTTPIRVPEIEPAVEIAAGPAVSMARLNDGRIVAWGSNADGLIDAYAYRPDLGEPNNGIGDTDLITPLGPHEIPGFGSTPTPPPEAPRAPWLNTEVNGNRVILTWGTDGVTPLDTDRYFLLYASYPAATPAGRLSFYGQYRYEVDLPPGSAYYALVYRDGVRDNTHYLGVTPFSNIEVISVPRSLSDYGGSSRGSGRAAPIFRKSEENSELFDEDFRERAGPSSRFRGRFIHSPTGS